jgi:hypothetical protein
MEEEEGIEKWWGETWSNKARKQGGSTLFRCIIL